MPFSVAVLKSGSYLRDATEYVDDERQDNSNDKGNDTKYKMSKASKTQHT